MSTEQQEPGPGKPHDALYRRIFGVPENAGSMLRATLPAQLGIRIDWDALTLLNGSFVSTDLQLRYADMLYTTKVDGEDAYVFILAEHQRRPDRWMALRMVTYQVRIWEDHRRRHKTAATLPMIIPVVIYQGRRRWTPATNVADLIDASPETATAAGDLLAQAAYHLVSLALIDDEALLRWPLTPAARITIVTLGLDPNDPDVTVRLLEFYADWQALLAQPDGSELFATLLTYLRRTTDLSNDSLYQFATTLGPQAQEVAVTNEQALLARGHAEGFTEGRAELLIDLLALKFGAIDNQTHETIMRAGSEQIATWSARLVQGAPTLADIFA